MTVTANTSLIPPERAKLIPISGSNDAPDLENAVGKWTESNRQLESHGSQFGLAPLYKVIALMKIMVGRAKKHCDLWEADNKHEADCGICKMLETFWNIPEQAKLE